MMLKIDKIPFLFLQKAIGEKEGLKDMLTTAREEEPLEAWEGIKVVKESDLKDQNFITSRNRRIDIALKFVVIALVSSPFAFISLIRAVL